TKSLEIFNYWRDQNGLELPKALSQAAKLNKLTPKAKKALTELGDIIASFQSATEELTPEVLLDKLIKRLNYFDYLNDGTAQGEARIENVRELLSVARQYQDAGLDGFLEEVALVSDLDSANLKESSGSGEAVTLMTLHSAKGLEFPVVFITGLEENIL